MLRHSSNSQTPFAKGAGAWFHDATYIAASFIVWNWRKSRFRRSRGTMRCPCQSLSDSGRVGESRCEASYYLKDPRRFSIVCPALKNTPDGLRCHLSLEDVRPFWGRAIGLASILLCSLYLLGATLTFGVFRAQGYDTLSWADCAWPPQWRQFNETRAQHYRTQAQAALVRDDLSTTIRALSRAVKIQPEDWKSGLLLAELYERVGQFAASEDLFISLNQRFPEQTAQIARVHHDSVLASQRYDSLQELALRGLISNDASVSPDWLRALLTATLETDNPTSLWTNQSSLCEQLSDDQRVLLEVVAPPLQESTALPAARLADHKFQSSALVPLRWEVLYRANLAELADTALAQDKEFLNSFTLGMASWLVSGPTASDFIYSAQWEDLVPATPKLPEYFQLCTAALISSRPVDLNVLKTRIPKNNHHATAALWIVASLSNAPDIANELLEELHASGYPHLSAIDRDNLRSQIGALFTEFSISTPLKYALIRESRPLPSPPRFKD